MDEIFSLVRRELERAGYASRLSAGLVLTGGAAALEGVVELATDGFGLGVRVGSPADHIGGLSDAVEAPRFSTVVGLAQYGAHRLALGGAVTTGKRMTMPSPSVERLAGRVKTWLQDFF
jgi:cell division protein FtsA